MPTGYTVNNVDVDQIYELREPGDPVAAATGYSVPGGDLSTLFCPLSMGSRSTAADPGLDVPGMSMHDVFAANNSVTRITIDPTTWSGKGVRVNVRQSASAYGRGEITFLPFIAETNNLALHVSTRTNRFTNVEFDLAKLYSPWILGGTVSQYEAKVEIFYNTPDSQFGSNVVGGPTNAWTPITSILGAECFLNYDVGTPPDDGRAEVRVSIRRIGTTTPEWVGTYFMEIFISVYIPQTTVTWFD